MPASQLLPTGAPSPSPRPAVLLGTEDVSSATMIVSQYLSRACLP